MPQGEKKQGLDLGLDHFQDFSGVKLSIKSREQSSDLPLQYPWMKFINALYLIFSTSLAIIVIDSVMIVSPNLLSDEKREQENSAHGSPRIMQS